MGGLRSRKGPAQVVLTVVPDSPELIGRSVGGEPLLNGELLLRARRVDAGGGDLDVIAVPTVMGPRAVGSKVDRTNRPIQAGASAAEDIEVAPFEVVVTRTH